MILFSVLPPPSSRLVDDFGDTLRIRVPFVRIVSLDPTMTEILFAIGAGGAVVGAVAGQVLGRDTKSTVIGAAVGAAAGAAAANASARYDTCLPAGAPVQVTLRDALTLRV